ncbi:hypothetical protein ACFFF7_03940 [Novosphingobium aquiterrae]|uniref:Chorismate lyase n=1 Tax=Novosphingobium aquiterrae TaxID=624388 RepID=A0ABV6PFE7_9SPHN
MTLASAAGLASACTADHDSIAALERALQSNPSATRALEGWCAARGLDDHPSIVARRLKGEAGPEPEYLRARLGVTGDAQLGYRHVELVCGNRVLSVAHNWYLREHLSAEMNAALDGSEIPFGKVVAPLRFTRETIDSRHGGEPGCPPGTVLSQIALLRLPDGRPLALVTECYTRSAIAK